VFLTRTVILRSLVYHHLCGYIIFLSDAMNINIFTFSCAVVNQDKLKLESITLLHACAFK